MIDFAIEKQGRTTIVYDIVKRHFESICALRYAQNYCKLRQSLSVIMCRLEVECAPELAPKQFYICAAQEEVFGKWF